MNPNNSPIHLELAHDGELTFQKDKEKGMHQVTLRFRGAPLYQTGFGCDTCRAMFAAAGNPQTPLTPAELSDLLAGELNEVTSEIINTVTPLLPSGRYLVGLLRTVPRLADDAESDPLSKTTATPVTPVGGGENAAAVAQGSTDYRWICRESYTEKIDGTLWRGERLLPCIRARSEDEILLPHRARATYDVNRLQYYRTSRAWMHTALALSIVEDRDWGCKHSHTRLTHFLLDGHHKTMAASRGLQPLQILSFLNLSRSARPLDELTIRRVGDYHRRRPPHWLCDGETWGDEDETYRLES